MSAWKDTRQMALLILAADGTESGFDCNWLFIDKVVVRIDSKTGKNYIIRIVSHPEVIDQVIGE